MSRVLSLAALKSQSLYRKLNPDSVIQEIMESGHQQVS